MSNKRVRFHEHGLHDDIRYSGPFSFQSFQILGWICITLTAVMYLTKMAMKVNPDDSARFENIANVISYIAAMSLPFLLMANFARILNNSEGYKKQLLRNGGAMVGLVLAFLLIFNRYIVGTVGLRLEDPSDAWPIVMNSFYFVIPRGFICFNIFVDLFLCTVFMYFMNARPKKVFTGNKILIFRAFALLPVLYEVGSMLLKALSVSGQATIPSWVFPFLTVKPPMTFVVFMILAIHIKTRELRYCRHGKTHEEYQEFLKTNRNSWHFSVFSAIVVFIAGVVDFLIFILLLSNQAASSADSQAFLDAVTTSEAVLNNSIPLSLGFGKSIALVVFAPLLLLFNYTKIPKVKEISVLIPVAGIALIGLVAVQGAYQLVAIMPGPKMNGKELNDVLISIFSLLAGG